MTHSVCTISDAIRKWKAFNLESFAVSQVVRKPNANLSDSSSGGQAFLEGVNFIWDGDEKEYDGHISLSPMDKGLGYCQSAHLTIVGSKNNGNYFFDIDSSGASPGAALFGKKGQSSKRGMDLPVGLRTDVEKILDKLLTFP